MPEKATNTRSSTSHGQGLAFEVFKPRLVDAAKPVRWISPLIEQGEHLHNARGGIQRVVDRLGGAGQMVLPARKWQLIFPEIGLVPVADLGEALQEIDHIEEPVLTRPAIDAKSSITDRAISTLQALLIARPLHAERLLRLFDGKHVAAFHGGDPAPELAGFVVGLIPLARHAKSHGERQPSLSDDGADEKVDAVVALMPSSPTILVNSCLTASSMFAESALRLLARLLRHDEAGCVLLLPIGLGFVLRQFWR